MINLGHYTTHLKGANRLTSGNSLKIASSAAALALSILDAEVGDAPRHET